MKDADKGWRATPHGMKTICGWYNWQPEEYADALTKVSLPYMLTAPGRALANGMITSVKAQNQLSYYLEDTSDD